MQSGSPIAGIITLIVWLVLIIAAVAGIWKMFVKAGKPGWAVLIPIYNIYILLKISGKPGWWILLFFVPILNIIISILAALGLAKAFGRSSAFGIVALWFFSIIGYMILGFGKSKYVGVQAPPANTTPPSAPIEPAPAVPAPPTPPQPTS